MNVSQQFGRKKCKKIKNKTQYRIQARTYAPRVKHNPMNIDEHIEKFILSADSKALATYGVDINVVPVSSIKIVDGNIWLIDYFMGKTIANISNNQSVALVCWKKMMGYQIKGTIEYKTKGDDFNNALLWIKEILPDRIVKGLLILKPDKIYDISPTKDTKQKFLNEQFN